MTGVELICGISFTSSTFAAVSVPLGTGVVSERVNETVRVPSCRLPSTDITSPRGKLQRTPRLTMKHSVAPSSLKITEFGFAYVLDSFYKLLGLVSY